MSPHEVLRAQHHTGVGGLQNHNPVSGVQPD